MSDPARPGQILVIDDDPGVLMAARLALGPHVEHVETLSDPAGLEDALASRPIEAVLMDMNFTPGANSGREGLDWLDRLRALDPTLSVVVMTAYGGVALAVETLKQGAVDFVLKPWRNEKLIATVSAAAALTRAKRQTEQALLRGAEVAGARAREMIGGAPAFQRVLKLIRRAAPTDAPALILGESGCGKEAAAREIHRLSRRARQPFVSVTLGAVSEGHLESELFGHRRGAFAGADSDRAGRLQGADGGTLFLDEISLLPAHLQRKLLSVLERGEVTPLGAAKPTPIDVRLITASNLPLAALARDDTLPPELLLRLRTVEIALPPLRERREDIAALLEHFLAAYARQHNAPRRRLSPEALRLLEAHDWPGNIRELRHAAERAAIIGGDERLEPQDFPFLFAAPATGAEEQFDLDQLEKETIGRAMVRFNGNISMAATALGLTRPALYRRLEKHGF
jgi:DNA-binding NtrC family response regulator